MPLLANHRQLEDSSRSKGPPGSRLFTVFSSLPPEVRYHIWRDAVAPPLQSAEQSMVEYGKDVEEWAEMMRSVAGITHDGLRAAGGSFPKMIPLSGTAYRTVSDVIVRYLTLYKDPVLGEWRELDFVGAPSTLKDLTHFAKCIDKLRGLYTANHKTTGQSGEPEPNRVETSSKKHTEQKLHLTMSDDFLRHFILQQFCGSTAEEAIATAITTIKPSDLIYPSNHRTTLALHRLNWILLKESKLQGIEFDVRLEWGIDTEYSYILDCARSLTLYMNPSRQCNSLAWDHIECCTLSKACKEIHIIQNGDADPIVLDDTRQSFETLIKRWQDYQNSVTLEERGELPQITFTPLQSALSKPSPSI